MSLAETVKRLLFGEDVPSPPDGAFEIYQCKACGWGVTDAENTGAIGTAHAHAEGHTGLFSFGNPVELDRFIRRLKVEDFEEIPTDIEESDKGDAS